MRSLLTSLDKKTADLLVDKNLHMETRCTAISVHISNKYSLRLIFFKTKIDFQKLSWITIIDFRLNSNQNIGYRLVYKFFNSF